MGAAHPAGLVEMRVWPFQVLAAPPQQTFPAAPANAAAIGVDGVAFGALIDPVLWPAIGFADVRPHPERLQLHHLLLAVIALVGHEFLGRRDRIVGDRRDGVELVHVTEEDEYFPPPRELRELIPADDRTISAAEVLASLVRTPE